MVLILLQLIDDNSGDDEKVQRAVLKMNKNCIIFANHQIGTKCKTAGQMSQQIPLCSAEKTTKSKKQRVVPHLVHFVLGAVLESSKHTIMLHYVTQFTAWLIGVDTSLLPTPHRSVFTQY